MAPRRNPKVEKALKARSDEEISDALFIEDTPQQADLIIVLGNREKAISRKRARRAVQLYRDGYAPMIVASGGHNGAFIEADLMFEEIVQRCHVLEEVVLRDSHSRTTKENFEKIKVILTKKGLYRDNLRAILVSCPWHMLRAKHLTKKYFPQFKFFCCPHRESCAADEWVDCDSCKKLIRDGTAEYFSEGYLVERDGLFP